MQKRIVIGIALFVLLLVSGVALLRPQHSGLTDPVMRRYEEVRTELERAIRKSPETALALLRERIVDPMVARVCHGLAHEIGRMAEERLGASEALRIDDDICGSGYVHGVIETRFAEVGDAAAMAQGFCATKDGRCFHGLGHGFMYASRNDLPGSLRLCSSLPERSASIQCAEGVFMENFGVDTSAHPTAYLREDDPFFPCREPAEPYKGVCAFYAPRYYLKQHPEAYAEALRWCTTLPKGPADACAKGVGSVAVKEHIDDPSFVQTICEGGAPEQTGYCMEGLVSYTIVHYASVEKGREICPQLHPEHRPTCEKIAAESQPFFGE